MLTVVEDQQQFASADEREDRGFDRSACWRGDVEIAGKTDGDLNGIANRREIDPQDPVTERVCELSGDLERQTRFSDTARSHKSDEPVFVECLGDPSDVVTATDEGARGGGKVVGWGRRDEIELGILVEDLMFDAADRWGRFQS